MTLGKSLPLPGSQFLLLQDIVWVEGFHSSPVSGGLPSFGSLLLPVALCFSTGEPQPSHTSKEGPFGKVGRLTILGTLPKHLIASQSSLDERPPPERAPGPGSPTCRGFPEVTGQS